MYHACAHRRLTDDEVTDLCVRAALLDLTPGPVRITECPTVPDFLSVLLPGLTRMAVIALYPLSQIIPHIDLPVKGSRYHIPIRTNVGCWSFHDGVWSQLLIGQVYHMDLTKLHGAVNWGTDVRLSLLIDQ